MATILVVDDEEEILTLIRNSFKKENYEIVCVSNATEVNKQYLPRFDLILLDVMMPDKDGFSLCSEIRGQVDCPILFLTAKSLEEDIEFGFSIGADDYIKKPFSIVELRARVKAHLRREQREHNQVLSVGDVRFYLHSREIFLVSEKLPMTKSEYAICELMAKNRPQIFSKEQIFESVFGYDSDSDEATIKEHVKNIRRKFAVKGIEPIVTVWGIGYRWQ